MTLRKGAWNIKAGTFSNEIVFANLYTYENFPADIMSPSLWQIL